MCLLAIVVELASDRCIVKLAELGLGSDKELVDCRPFEGRDPTFLGARTAALGAALGLSFRLGIWFPTGPLLLGLFQSLHLFLERELLLSLLAGAWGTRDPFRLELV